MRIVRFLDDRDQTRYGCKVKNNTAKLLKGNLFEGFTESGVSCRVKKILAPVEPCALLCIGLNYHHHARETGYDVPEYPILFMKNPAAVNNPGDPILLHPACMKPPEVDYEAELAVVIGRPAKDVPASEALRYVAGYTAANDVSARRWQGKRGGGQWNRGKSFDTFCPLGPELVTSDELRDPQNLRVSCVLNGRVMQDASTSDMIFPVAELIAHLSIGTTLLPGSVILTGTPSGVGFARTPPVYLMPGDTVEVTVDGIGTLRNPVELQK